jgi:hypothetical protein
LGQHAATPEPGDFLGLDFVVVDLTTMDGFPLERVPEDKRQPCAGAEIGEPLPREATFDTDNQIRSVRCNGLETWRRCGLHMPVQQDLSVLIQDAAVHGAGLPVDAAVKLVWFRVEAPEVSAS